MNGNETDPTAQIISVRFPAGISFLGNILLELDLCVFHHDYDIFWYRRGQDTVPNPVPTKRFLLWFPALARRTEFRFQEGIRIRQSHHWPDPRNRLIRTVLLVRDGRDTLLSEAHRKGKGGPPEEYLAKRGQRFPLSAAEEWALFYRLWLRAGAGDALLVTRFEDLKQNGVEEVKRILSFLHCSRPEPRIEEAIARSSTEAARQTSERTSAQFGGSRIQMIRAGKVGEWRGAEAAMLGRLFNGFPAEVLDELGYAVSDGTSTGAPPPSRDEAEMAGNLVSERLVPNSRDPHLWSIASREWAALLAWRRAIATQSVGTGGPEKAGSRGGRELVRGLATGAFRVLVPYHREAAVKVAVQRRIAIGMRLVYEIARRASPRVWETIERRLVGFRLGADALWNE